MDKIKCKCGKEWKISEKSSEYEGEVVLKCECGKMYFNAQMDFNDEEFKKLEYI